MPSTVVFDVNETLLDLGALDPLFADLFGAAEAREDWFARVLRTALLTTVTEAYTDFSDIGAAALEDLAEERGLRLSRAEREAVLDGMEELPPHDDAPPALKHLRAQGHRLAALTNSPQAAATAKLRHAGLAEYFEQILSADDAGLLKPAPAPYRRAARRLDVRPAEVCFVAAHDWDIAGARAVGCTGAFVARPGKRLGPLVARPEIVGSTLEAVAEQIVA